MSSDLYVLDGSLHHHHSSPEMVSCDGELFFSDPFSPFFDPSIDILQEFSTNHTSDYQSTTENTSSLEDLSQAILLSSSPPSQQLENMSLYQTTQFQPNLDSVTNSNCYRLLDDSEVKLEECQVGFNDYEASYSSYLPCVPRSYSCGENAVKMMQRSFSSHSFDGKLGSGGFLFRPRFDTLLEPPNYQSRALSSPEDHSSFSGHLRRVYSAGDLQDMRPTRTSTGRSLSSPFASDSSFIEEGNLKVGRYSAEERRERISKYRAKRNQRNFTKTIKYACRKTLADNRPRVRGRFARNDETGEIPKVACSAIDEHDDESWFEGHEEEGNGATVGGGVRLLSNFGNPQFLHQYYGY